ncbi:MAG: YgcG family protein, partial [bacterium]
VIPEFRQGEYGKGLYQGAVYCAGLIAREEGVTITGIPTVTRRVSRDGSEGRGGGIIPILFILFLIIVTRGRIIPWLFLGLLMGGGRGRGFGGGGFGGGFGGFGGGMSGGGGASRGF